MKKNSHIHILVTTNFLNKLKNEAEERMITLSELCRLKIQENLQLDRIEFKLDKLLKLYEKK